MQLNVGKEIAALEEMPVAQLRDRYAEVFGETTNARNKQWMVKKIIWRLQSLAEGDLSERARARAMEIALQRCKTFWTNASENSALLVGFVQAIEFIRGGQVNSRKNGSRWGNNVPSLEPNPVRCAVSHSNS